MADREDFVSFEKALRELQLNEDQLKRLVSEGEIRAIRGEHNTMRFRRDEIERLKADTGKTIQYTEESSDTLTDDLLFDESDELEVEDEGMATAQISSEDTFVGPATTQPVAKAPKPAPAAPRKGAAPKTTTAGLRRTTGRSTRMRAATAEKAATGIGMGIMAMLILTAIISLYVLPFIFDIANNSMSGPTSGLASWCGENFGDVKPR